MSEQLFTFNKLSHYLNNKKDNLSILEVSEFTVRWMASLLDYESTTNFEVCGIVFDSNELLSLNEDQLDQVISQVDEVIVGLYGEHLKNYIPGQTFRHELQHTKAYKRLRPNAPVRLGFIFFNENTEEILNPMIYGFSVMNGEVEPLTPEEEFLVNIEPDILGDIDYERAQQNLDLMEEMGLDLLLIQNYREMLNRKEVSSVYL